MLLMLFVFVFVGIAVHALCGDCRLCVLGRRLGVVCGNKCTLPSCHTFSSGLIISHHFTSFSHVLVLSKSYYFQAYTPKTAAEPASHKHLHHWVFLIDANVNDYEEDNADYGHASIGKISAHLTARNMGLEDTPASFGEIIPLVMTRTLQRVSSSIE